MSARQRYRAKVPGFAKLYHPFIDEKIEPLSSGATRLYIAFLRRYNGYNNAQIPFSVREAAAWCRCGLATAQSYLRELQEQGLIEPVVIGSFQIKLGDQKNAATTWRLPRVTEGAGA